MKRRKFKKLMSKFVILCIVPASILLILLCVVSVILNDHVAYKNLKNSMIGQSISKHHDLEATINFTLGNVKFEEKSAMILNLINEASGDNVKEKSEYSDLQDIADRIKNTSSYFTWVGIADIRNEVIIDSAGQHEYEPDPKWYNEEKFNECEPYFTQNSIIKDRNIPMIVYTYPIKDSSSSEITGAIILYFNNNYFIDKLKMETNFQHQAWLLFSPDSDLLFSSVEYDNKTIDKILKIGDMEEKGTGLAEHLNNGKYILHQSIIEPIDNCKLIYLVPMNVILSQSLITASMMAIITILSIGIIYLSIRSINKDIVSEIQDIIKGLKIVAECNFSEQMEVKSNDEVGLLIKEFNTTIDALKYQAEHDRMTDFLNAKTFYQKAESFVVPYDDIEFALIRLDLDNFSFINDIYGWEVGNEVLVKISVLIRNTFVDDVLYGHIGGDVFVICLKYKDQDEMLKNILKLADEIKACDKRLNLTPHFGIYNHIKNGENMNLICDYAGIALKAIKGNLLKTYAFYNNEFDDKHKELKFIESQKQIALDNNQFCIYLQPKCDINTGEILGAEALVRWKSPERDKMISPGSFIPIFEKNGFIIPLDKYVWEESCKVLKKWRDNSCREIPISVNVSRMHIFNTNFVNEFEKLTRKYGISPMMLDIEVTESALLENGENILEDVMLDLKSRGFRLMMDDFASGYSSLIALKKLPFDVIKIDKGLIDNIDEPKNKQLVIGVVSMLKKLNKDIVIEGVEHEWQREALKDTGCRVIQGFCFSRPIPVEDFEKLAFGKVIE